ncbi:CPBP family intramembrane glutamic endopeptidase, partial [Mycobacterium tuberculosis]|uniref:CPBP family intramembrane glutamic endopeptidase n=1 Tax=Mycobacterium tuberculosis TaxID=1773 RepID=UPI000B1ED997
EELLTRGYVVTMMRRAGHGEIAVAVMSAGVFAALHIGNAFTSDQSIVTTALQVVYTFFFGICMYLALRVTGTIWAPILLHASTDPTLSLHGAYPESNLFGAVSV